MFKLLSKIYHSKWCPRFFYKKNDGGKESGVVGYFLIEWKPVFSIGLLRFSAGSREAYHTHAFNAYTWWLKGHVEEEQYLHHARWRCDRKTFKPSLKPKFTPRDNCHKVIGVKKTWAFTLRGPWEDTWQEYRPTEDKMVTLTHGRKEVE